MFFREENVNLSFTKEVDIPAVGQKYFCWGGYYDKDATIDWYYCYLFKSL